MSERKAVTKKLALAYRNGAKADKSKVLDDLVMLTGWHRDHARAQLRAAVKPKVVKPRSPRPPKFRGEVVSALAVCWEVARYPAGKRLAPMLNLFVPALVDEGVLQLSEKDQTSLMSMSPASIDRHLAPRRRALGWKGRSHTKPGTLLKSQIPIRTWHDWNEDMPGFVEIDLVGHEGGNPAGEFCFTLTMTDIATGWTVNRSIKNKASIWVMEAIDFAAKQFPFPILGIDSDNGSEFINAHLFDYCHSRKITFTRSRPGNKNDGAHVEQKNWTHVRQLVGYLRFDTDKELKVLNEIWQLDQRFTNHLLVQSKLVERHREGAKVVKRHDKPKTPVERFCLHDATSEMDKRRLEQVTSSIAPKALGDQIAELLTQLEHLNAFKPKTKPPMKVNRSFNAKPDPEIFGEAMNQRSRRI